MDEETDKKVMARRHSSRLIGADFESIGDGMETRVLPQGAVVHVNGLPFRLRNETMISGQTRNFELAYDVGAQIEGFDAEASVDGTQEG